jgi:hypothetical protein
MIGVIYKLCCEGVDEFYIGSSKNMYDRKRLHKSRCNNVNYSGYNNKLYSYIRNNKGYNEWKYEILEEFLFEIDEELKIQENTYIKNLNPSLNKKKSHQTHDELLLQQRENYKKRGKIICECGREVSRGNKSHHLNSKIHQKYITNNITNNITNLHIHN